MKQYLKLLLIAIASLLSVAVQDASAAFLCNNGWMNTSTVGTGTMTLTTALTGAQTFADCGIANAQTVRYRIVDGGNWEVGTGTYTSVGTTLSRTVLESNNSDTAINLSGTATVFIAPLTSDMPHEGTPIEATIDETQIYAFIFDANVYERALLSVIEAAFDLNDLSGTLGIAKGGTGSTSAADAFTALKQAASETATGVVEQATTAECEAGTDTSRYCDPADILAAVTGKKPIWLPAGSFVPRTTAGCAMTDTFLDPVMLRACWYDQTTEEGSGFAIRMPDTWDEGTLTAQVVWTHPATATNFGVVWGISCVAISNDDPLDAVLGSQVTVTDTGGTTTDQYTSDATAAITCGGTPAAGDWVYFEVERVAGSGSDSLAVDAYYLGTTIYYNDNAFVEP